MFSKLTYHNNWEGKLLHPPRLLHAKDIRSKCFYLQTCQYNAPSALFPAIHIMRESKDFDDDPYNETGCISILLTTIINPFIEFSSDAITIHGLECPNLCWCGQVSPSHKGCRKLDISPTMIWANPLHKHSTIERFNFQKIVIQ